jgi:hypothetical protein
MIPAVAEPAVYSHPLVSTLRTVDDAQIVAHRLAHPGAFDTWTPPPQGFGPGGPVKTRWVRIDATHGYNDPPGLT